MVIADINTPSVPVSDVVFVIEGTANLVADINVLKKSYIIPTLEYFNEGPPDPTDYGCDHSSTLYVLVVFHAGDITPEPAAYCSGPTTSIDQFIKWIDDIQFIGGAGEACSHIAEGLSTAIQVFDDMKAVRGASASFQRHCILVCNSPPYQMTSQESLNYSGYSSEQLASMMGKRGINLSLISPRKIPNLQLLFDEGNSELQIPPKEFTVDPRHHVQLSGFQLQEQSHNGPSDEDKQSSENLKTSPAATTNSPAPGSQLALRAVTSPAPITVVDSSPQFRVPGTAPSQVISQQPSPQPIVSHSITSMPQSVSSVSQITPGHPGNINPNPVNKAPMTASVPGNMPVVSQQNLPQGQQSIPIPPNRGGNILPNVNQQTPNQTDMTTWNSDQSKAMHPNPISRQGIIPRNQNVIITQATAPPGSNTAPTQMMTPSHEQGSAHMISSSQSLGPGSIPFSNPLSQSVVQDPSPAPSLHPAIPSQPARERIYIWTGALEWQEKPKTPVPNGPQRLTHSLACRVSIGPNDPEIQAAMWPNKLIMQLIPQVLLNQLQTMFHHARSVVFNFSDSDPTALRNLYTVMGRGFAGCVHFPPVTQCDVRVLMLVYSQKKKTFMGLIPTDQSIFVNGIRTVITEHKKKTIAAAANASNRFQQSTISIPSIPGSQASGITQMPVSTANSTMSLAVTSNQPPISSITQPNPGQSSQLTTSQVPSGQIQQGSQNQGGQSTMMENTMRIANLQQTLQTAQKRGLQYQHQAEAAKKALEVAARQQHLLEEMQYYGGPPPNMYSAQQQRMQLQTPPQQQPAQQQTPVTNQQLRHLLLNQQAQQQQQQMRQQMMMRAAAPQTTGMPGPAGSGQQQSISQVPPSQGNYMEDFNIGDLMQ